MLLPQWPRPQQLSPKLRQRRIIGNDRFRWRDQAEIGAVIDELDDLAGSEVARGQGRSIGALDALCAQPVDVDRRSAGVGGVDLHRQLEAGDVGRGREVEAETTSALAPSVVLNIGGCPAAA
jgi:hypothetical protein